MFTRTVFAFALASASFALTALPAAAADVETHKIQVRFADADLLSDAGVAKLDERIVAAANHACGPVDHRDLSQFGSFRDCRDAAVASAEAKLQERVAAIRGSTQYAMAPKAEPNLH
ncbi:MAG TPA: UrcA family protein [Stellaceae bacterium]|nr:UrcA family protein [Stellaceae bacterium]